MIPTRPPYHVPPDDARKGLEQREAMLIGQLAFRPWTPVSARAAHLLALDSAGSRAALDPDDPNILIDLDRAACACAGLFASLLAGVGGKIEAPLPGSYTTVTTTGASPDALLADPIDWRTGLLCALAVRNRGAIDQLARTPIEILRVLAPKDPEWAVLERQALQSLALLRPDSGDWLVDAARAADPATVAEISRDWVLDIVSPELQLGFCAIARDQVGFDRWMVEAIKAHHHYYYQTFEYRKKSPHSQIALAPLAMACMAHDLGVRTNVVSDYIPRWIIER